MAEQVVGRRSTSKTSHDSKQFTAKKNAEIQADEDKIMSDQYARVIGELKAAEARNR